MSIKYFSCFAVFLVSATANSQNAVNDSVSLGQSLNTSTQQFNFGSNSEIGHYHGQAKSAVQCTSPKPDGAGNCVTSCSDGTVNSYQGSSCYQPAGNPIPVYPTPAPNLLVSCTELQRVIIDGQGYCEATCTNGPIKYIVGDQSCE